MDARLPAPDVREGAEPRGKQLVRFADGEGDLEQVPGGRDALGCNTVLRESSRNRGKSLRRNFDVFCHLGGIS